MRRRRRYLAARLRRALRGEEGGMTLDFVLVFPLFVMLLLASFEAGILMTRFVMLERSLDMAARDLRLGTFAELSWDDHADEQGQHMAIKREICERVKLMPNCMRDLHLELRPVSRTTWNVFENATSCIDRTSEVRPTVRFNPGVENQPMLMRVCAIYDPFFPTTRLGLRLHLDSSGGYQLTAMSAFVNEPR